SVQMSRVLSFKSLCNKAPVPSKKTEIWTTSEQSCFAVGSVLETSLLVSVVRFIIVFVNIRLPS
ncbi:hypothetical protein, partial [Acinetobacter johnsonii]|uniref:hypothetical protein n=1 Tax=Acinetobacter johnsonii TaxID=40214 RepID=UPI001BB29AB1